MSKQNHSKINWDNFYDLSEKEIEDKAKEILSLMNLKQKAYQMSGDGSVILDGLKMLIRYNRKPIPAGDDKKLGIPGVKFSDGPRGVVMGHSTCFPVSMARGATWDPELEERIGEAIGIEAKAQGANFFGGVCINLLRHPAWGRAQETYGEDTTLLGILGTALVKGVQKHIMACAKHYACNSMENARFKVDVSIDERTLREVYLPHFKKCVDTGVASIMSAYNKVNGKYCGHNPHILRDILKKDWNFKGFVITDFFLGIRNGKVAANAGIDIEMPFQWRMKPKKLVKLVKKGELSEEYIDEAVLRILKQKLRFTKKRDPGFYTKEKVACKEHTLLALEAARKSMVLLKNKDNILPLNRNNTKKIALIGKLANIPNIGDMGSSRVYPPYIITPLQGIKKAGESIDVLYEDGTNLENVENIANDVDIVIFIVGYTHRDEGEYIGSKGGDRKSLRLRQKDEDLISKISQINKNCIVVLEGGSAIITEEWKDKVPAIIMAWYPGMEGGTALAEIIFGDYNPCGKLPVVFPKSSEHLPFFDRSAISIEYGYYHGYKLMDKEGYEPAFPFGFGLSYTSYSYNNLKIDKDNIREDEEIQVSVEISNEGKISGEEIIQMYVGYKKSAVDRPIKDLKGFRRLFLDAGEIKTITLNLKAEDLAYYDTEKGKWFIEKIEYEIFIGPSSNKEDLLSISFRVS